MKKNIITISREYGSGGHEIGKLLAERLGYQFYDKELVERVAEKTLLPESFIERYGEHSRGTNVFSNFFYSEFAGDPSTSRYIFDMQQQIIKDIAKDGNCVIVGRCADYYLKYWDNVLSVFITSDMAARIRRIAERDNCSIREAEELIRDTDKKRSLNYQYCTDQKWGQRDQYHLILNSSVLGIDTCVNLIEQLVR